MTDYMGQEINIGDRVIVAIGRGKNSGASLSDGTVVGITANYIKVAGTSDYTGCKKSDTILVSSFKAVVIKET